MTTYLSKRGRKLQNQDLIINEKQEFMENGNHRDKEYHKTHIDMKIQ